MNSIPGNKTPFQPWLFLSALVAWPASLFADAPPAMASLRGIGTNSEGRRTYSLQWEAAPNALYRLQARSGFESNTAWNTIDLAQPAGARGEYSFAEGALPLPEADTRQFLRVLEPQPVIFRVEPAFLGTNGGTITLFGQCLGTNVTVRIGRLVIPPSPIVPGTAYTFDIPPGALGEGGHDVEVLDGTNVLARADKLFTVGGAFDLAASGQRLLEVPVDPPASPALKAKEKANRTQCANNLRVVPSTGELQLQETDLFVAGRGIDFAWTRSYRSRTGRNTPMGQGWSHSYDVRAAAGSNSVTIFDGTGRSDTYFRDPSDGSYTANELFNVGVFTNGTFWLVFPDGGRWEFSDPDGGAPGSGRLQRIVDRHGNALHLSHSIDGQLLVILDTLGRTNTISYDALGRIESVTDFSGRSVVYTYYRSSEAGGSEGDLKSVRSPIVTGTPNTNDFPEGRTTTYTYSAGFPDARLNHNLVTVTDPANQTWFEGEYSASQNPADVNFDRVVNFRRGEPGTARTFLNYTRLTPSPNNRFAVMQTIVNDPVGNVTIGRFDSLNRGIIHRDLAARAKPGELVTETNLPTVKLRDTDPDYWETTYAWNLDSLCTRVTFPRGNSTEFVYQRAFNQNDSRGNNGREGRRSDGNPRVIREHACCADLDGDGAPEVEALVWRLDFDPRFGSPALLCSAGRAWTFPSGPRQSTSLDASRASGSHPPIFKGGKAWDGIVSSSSGLFRKFNRQSEDSYQPWETEDEAVVVNPLYQGSGQSGVNPIHQSSRFVVRAIDARGNVDVATFNDQGSVLSIEHRGHLLDGSDAPHTNFEYSPEGQLSALTHPGNGTGFRRRDEFSYAPETGLLRTFTVDAQGPTVSLVRFEHDARGNVSAVVDARGSTNRFIHNALDEVVRAENAPVCNPCGPYLTDYFHDANGNLIRVERNNVDSSGAIDAINPTWTTLFEHDALNRRTLIAHELAHTVQQRFATNRFTYDAIDNVVEAASPESVSGAQPGNRTALEYDTRQFLWRQTEGPFTVAASTDEFAYDENGNLVLASYGAGGGAGGMVFKRTFDGFDRCITIADPMGNLSLFTYDNNHNLVAERHDGEFADLPGSAGNLRLAETRYEYDSLGRRVKSRAAFFDLFTGLSLLEGEQVTAFAYAPNGACNSVTDPLGKVTTYGYDSRGRLTAITDPKTNAITCTYDANDNLLSVVQNEASDLSPARQLFFTRYEYDAWNRRVVDYDNVGNTNRYFFDARDNLVVRIDAGGNRHLAEFDGLNRKVSTAVDLDGDGVIGPNDAVTRQVWDDNSRLVQVIDGNSNVTRHAYDELNRLRKTDYPDQTVLSLVWSPRSNLSSRTDPNGTTTTFTYDELGRCVRKDIQAAAGVAKTTTFEQFAYDGLSRCVLASNDVSLTSFGYDSLGNVTRQRLRGHDVLIVYDQNSRRAELRYPGGRVVNYSYNTVDEIVEVSSSPGGDLPSVLLASFAYDGPGRWARMARGNNVNTRLTWNGLQNPGNAPDDFGWRQISGINHQASGGGEIIDRRAATYDRNQNKALRQQLVPFATGVPALTTNIFAYDALDRLKSFSRHRASTAHTKSMELDRNGNRLSLTSNGVVSLYTMDNSAPEPQDFQVDQYTVTPFGGQQYDRNGNLISRDTAFGSIRFTYDYASRLVRVERSVGPAYTPVASYEYDALGRRIARTDYPPAPAEPVTTQFVLDPVSGEILEEREKGTLKKTVVFPHVLETSGRIIVSGAGEMFFTHADDLGSALAVTDSEGHVVERYDYDEYGAPRFLTPDGLPRVGTDGLPASSSRVGNDCLFRGLFWEGAVALYFGHSQGGTVGPLKWMAPESIRSRRWNSDPYAENSTRCFDPLTGRFITRNSPGHVVGERPRQAPSSFAADNPWSASSKTGIKLQQKLWHAANFRISGDGNSASVKFYFNPKEITIDKPVPWKTKREEGGRHTPFHNKAAQSPRVEVRGWDWTTKKAIIGKASHDPAMRTTFAVLLGGESADCGSDAGRLGHGAFGVVYKGRSAGEMEFRKILDRGQGGDSEGQVCGHSSHF